MRSSWRALASSYWIAGIDFSSSSGIVPRLSLKRWMDRTASARAASTVARSARELGLNDLVNVF
jgi:hypothetical protein